MTEEVSTVRPAERGTRGRRRAEEAEAERQKDEQV
jgi:hypothetical protein